MSIYPDGNVPTDREARLQAIKDIEE